MSNQTSLPPDSYMIWEELPEWIQTLMSPGRNELHPAVISVNDVNYIPTSVVKEWLTPRQWRVLASEVTTLMVTE